MSGLGMVSPRVYTQTLVDRFEIIDDHATDHISLEDENARPYKNVIECGVVMEKYFQQH